MLSSLIGSRVKRTKKNNKPFFISRYVFQTFASFNGSLFIRKDNESSFNSTGLFVGSLPLNGRFIRTSWFANKTNYILCICNSLL